MEKIRRASVPHINFDFKMKPISDYTVYSKVMQFGWKSCGKFALYFFFLLILSVLVPYTIALATGSFMPILPLISPAGSNSIKSGLSSIGMFLSAVIGCIMTSVRYVQVSSQNESRNWQLNLLNKLSLGVGYVSFIGLIIVSSFPVNVNPPPQEFWNSSVFIAHMMGAFFSFFFGATYILLQTAISLFVYERNKCLVLIRFILFLACAVCFVTSTLSTIPADQKSEFDNLYFQSGIISKIVVKPNILGSASEWLLVFFFSLYFLTFVKEGNTISCVITFKRSTTERRISITSLTNMNKI